MVIRDDVSIQQLNGVSYLLNCINRDVPFVMSSLY